MLLVMNEIDPCLLLPLCVLYEIQNQIFQQLVSKPGFFNIMIVQHVIGFQNERKMVLMMREDRQLECLSRMELSYANLALRKQRVKGRSMGHRCGACHRTFDAKVRMVRIRISITVNQSFFFFFFLYLCRCEMFVYILASFSQSLGSVVNGGLNGLFVTLSRDVNERVVGAPMVKRFMAIL